MNKAKVLLVIKRLAAILLMVCFVLPLSRCTAKANPEGEVLGADIYFYGHEMAQDAIRDIEAGRFEGVVCLAGLFIVFFVPVVCIGLKEQLQAPICLLTSLPAGYVLFNWIFFFKSNVKIGAVTAATCWVLIFCASSKAIWGLWLSKARRQEDWS